jgi:hypothetical protein
MARVAHDGLAPSLAGYALSLSGGSRCFCCGKAFRTDECLGSTETTAMCVQRLICSHCGSGVADVLGSSSGQMEEPMTLAGARIAAG